jgi:uncharacterized protein
MTVGPVDRDDATAEFFDGTAAGRLLLRRCEHGHYSEPTVTQCTTCGSLELGWSPVGGGASLVSWAVTWSSGLAGVPGVDLRANTANEDVPTVLVIAELDEGPWWWSQLIAADPAELAVGTRLRIAFVRPEAEHEAVPVFELADY